MACDTSAIVYLFICLFHVYGQQGQSLHYQAKSLIAEVWVAICSATKAGGGGGVGGTDTQDVWYT